MNVAELIAELQKFPQDKGVNVRIDSPKESAWTESITRVSIRKNEDKVVIVGWVASDDESAYMPGMSD